MNPEISIIIPTYRRRESVLAVLQTIEKQSLPPEKFEVLVIDDGSGEDFAPVTDVEWKYRLRLIQQSNQGAAVARNNGASEAHGKFLFFMDDDIHLHPEYLDQLLTAYMRFEKAVLIGALHPYPRQGLTPFQKIYTHKNASLPRDPSDDFEAISYTECLTGMLSIERTHFFDLGMFQDLAGDGRVAWGDVDFGCRANRKGFQFIRCCRAIGFHDDHSISDILSFASRWKRASEDVVKLFQAYPETVNALPMFTDKKPINWRQDTPGLIIQKIMRQAASSQLALGFLQALTNLAERHIPNLNILGRLYQWVIGAYIFQGYRSGLVKYGPVTK